jgi:hypothetical protein
VDQDEEVQGTVSVKPLTTFQNYFMVIKTQASQELMVIRRQTHLLPLCFAEKTYPGQHSETLSYSLLRERQRLGDIGSYRQWSGVLLVPEKYAGNELLIVGQNVGGWMSAHRLPDRCTLQ